MVVPGVGMLHGPGWKQFHFDHSLASAFKDQLEIDISSNSRKWCDILQHDPQTARVEGECPRRDVNGAYGLPRSPPRDEREPGNFSVSRKRT